MEGKLTAARRGIDHGERRRGNPQGRRTRAKSDHRAEPVDVLECASGWPGADARPHRRARRRLQGSVLAIGWRRFSATRSRPTPPSIRRPMCRKSRTCSSSVGARGRRSHDLAGIRLRRRQEGHGEAAGMEPEDFFLTRKLTVEKFAKVEKWGEQFHDLWHAGLSRVPCRQTGSDLFGMGDPHPQHARLERPAT